MKPVIYVVVNQSLNMSAGKLAAQVGHAVALAVIKETDDNLRLKWEVAHHRWMIVLEAEDESHMRSAMQYLADRCVGVWDVIDEGVNEVRPMAMTAFATQILDKDGPHAALLAPLKKYSNKLVEREEKRRIADIAFNNGVRSRKWRYRGVMSGQPKGSYLEVIE